MVNEEEVHAKAVGSTREGKTVGGGSESMCKVTRRISNSLGREGTEEYFMHGEHWQRS